MKSKISKDTHESIVASAVATDWLKHAEYTLEVGWKPNKLSAEVKNFVHRQYEQGMLFGKKWNCSANKRIAKMAIESAVWKLDSGQYPTVLAYFKSIK